MFTLRHARARPELPSVFGLPGRALEERRSVVGQKVIVCAREKRPQVVVLDESPSVSHDEPSRVCVAYDRAVVVRVDESIVKEVEVSADLEDIDPRVVVGGLRPVVRRTDRTPVGPFVERIEDRRNRREILRAETSCVWVRNVLGSSVGVIFSYGFRNPFRGAHEVSVALRRNRGS